MRSQAYLFLGIACLAAAGLSAGSLPYLYNWFPDSQEGLSVVRIAFVAILVHIALARLAKENWVRVQSGLIVGIPALLLIFGLKQGALVLASSVAWAAFTLWVPWRSLKIAVACSLIVALFGLRKLGVETLGFWWIYVNWIRYLSMAIDSNARSAKWQDFSLCLQLIVAPPFFLGPLAMEWVSLRYAREKTEFDFSLEKNRKGAFLCVWALVLILLHHFIAPLLASAWSNESLSQIEGHAAQHIWSGFVFFLTRFWILGSLTAFAAGAWHLAGCSFKYDCDQPLRARDSLDFWRRYKNYSYDFLLRSFFIPTVLLSSRRFGGRVSTFLGLSAVLLAVAIVHVMNHIPIPGLDFRQSYSARGALQHGLMMGVFIGLTAGYAQLCDGLLRAAGLVANAWAQRVAIVTQVMFTLVTTSCYFYSAYAQMWMGWSLGDYLRSITSF